jgi:hypothetical protein
LHYLHKNNDEYAIYACGNRLVLYDLQTNRVLID